MITDKIIKIAITAYEYQFGTRDTQIKHALEAAYPLIRQQVLKEVNDAKNEAYHERNQVVAALAKLFPSGITRTNIEGWSDEWHGCVYIDLPTGQISYHYHDSEHYLFEKLPPYTKQWDGHTKDDVHDRLQRIVCDMMEGGE